MDRSLMIVLFVSALAMVFVFTFAQALEQTSKHPNAHKGSLSWTKPIAYVAIVFGVAVIVVQLFLARKLEVVMGILPSISGTIWLLILGQYALKRK